jgi:membrane dipeptidase
MLHRLDEWFKKQRESDLVKGIRSDFDGGGGIEGWSDASETFNVTLELVKRGYSEEEIEKLWGGNLLRVLDQVQAMAENGPQG